MDSNYDSKRTDASHGLRTMPTGPLADITSPAPRTVGELVVAISSMYPESDAESWDRMGLLVGDASEPLHGVAVALDPTLAAVAEAAEAGANVLLTHHPAFLDPPTYIRPLSPGGSVSSAVVFEAVRSGVALANWHTALDVSAPAQDMLPGLLRLRRIGVLEPLASDASRGYGQICVPEAGDAFDVARLAARCTATFGRAPRVWGSMQRSVSSVCTWTGSAGEATEDCIARGIDVLVCGEVKYHAALAASQAGLAIIELGHDVSELPFANVLAESAVAAGVGRDMISFVDRHDAWTYPETRRV